MLEVLLENMPVALLSAGLILMALEALSPGAHLIVVGVALVGLVGVLFRARSARLSSRVNAADRSGRDVHLPRVRLYGGKGTPQTKDSGSLAGATGYVTETITTRDGEVKLDDGGFAPYYSARTTSGTIEEGEEIIVLDPGGGNVLTVESLNAIGEDEIDRALAEDAASGPSSDGGGSTEEAAERETEKTS